MSNYSYLCCSNYSDIYPSSRYKAFDRALHTVACEIEAIPLLWLGLFRPADMRRRRLVMGEDHVTVAAPVAEAAKAFMQLDSAVPILNQLFRNEGEVEVHGALLKGALREIGGKFITIEMDEIVALHDEKTFYNSVRRVLAYLEDPSKEDQNAARKREALARLSRREKIQMVRDRAPAAGIAEVQRVLDQHDGDPSAAIRYFERLKSPVERAADRWSTTQKDSQGLDIQEVIYQITQVRPGVRFLKPGELGEAKDDERWNYSHLLGTTHERPVPWEA